MMLLLAAYFAVIMGSVTVAGYLFLRTRAEVAGGPSLQQAMEGILIPAGQLVARPGRGEESLRKQLFRAGYRAPSSYLVFHGIQVCLAVLTGVALGWEGGLLAALCGGGIGFLLPARVLEFQVNARARRIRRAVPASLDLLVLAIEAGQSLDHGMRDTSHSLRLLYPDICSELVFCHLEMAAGTSRPEALRRMGERSGDDELRKLAALLIDGERFGTSLGPALRTHSKYLRARMRSQAQEAARKLGVKLVIPVFFLIFPSVLLVTLGPAYLQMQGFLDNFLK